MDLLVVASMYYFVKKKNRIKKIKGIKSPGKVQTEDFGSHFPVRGC